MLQVRRSLLYGLDLALQFGQHWMVATGLVPRVTMSLDISVLRASRFISGTSIWTLSLLAALRKAVRSFEIC